MRDKWQQQQQREHDVMRYAIGKLLALYRKRQLPR